MIERTGCSGGFPSVWSVEDFDKRIVVDWKAHQLTLIAAHKVESGLRSIGRSYRRRVSRNRNERTFNEKTTNRLHQRSLRVASPLLALGSDREIGVARPGTPEVLDLYLVYRTGRKLLGILRGHQFSVAELLLKGKERTCVVARLQNVSSLS